MIGEISSKVVSKRHKSTGSDAFSFDYNRLDTTKFVLLSVFILVETTWPEIRSKPPPMNDVRDSKASL